ADRDDRVDLLLVHVAPDDLGAVGPVVEGVGAGGAQDRAADPADAAHATAGEGHPVPLDHAAPAVAIADELVLEEAIALDHRSADHRVQAGAVAAGGQDSDLHDGLALFSRASKGRGASAPRRHPPTPP